MALKEIRTDDISGEEGAEVVEFSFQGAGYEIDLSPANIKKFEKALEPWKAAARKAGRPAFKRTRVKSAQSSTDLNAIREWARSKGHTVSDRGRISKGIVDEFHKNHGPSFSNAES